MQDSGIPTKFPIPWGQSAGGAYIRSIPTASQIGIQNGAASLTDGFPPLNSLAVTAGGTPPFMQDHNGILKQITQWLQWFQAGGAVPWDSSFSSSVGGYPNGAIVGSGTYPGALWLSTADNNTTNPDAGGAGWVAFPIHGSAVFSSPGSTSWTAPAGVTRVKARGWGGGGGGGGVSGPNCASSGGSGGGYFEGWYSVSPGQVIAIDIGAGGTPGTGSYNGSPGGTTRFGTTPFPTATGGVGGISSTAGIATAPLSAGAATGGTLINQTGRGGVIGIQSATLFLGGAGGSAWGNPASVGLDSGADGTSGDAPGQGGDGTAATASASYSGGYGAPGALILEW